MVQTTGKSQAGGESGGLLIIPKTAILSLVKNEAKAPMPRGMAIHIISSFHCIFKKSPPYEEYVHKGKNILE